MRKILAVAGITYDNTTLQTVAPETVINNLDGGAIDAVFRNFSPELPVLDALLRDSRYHLMNFTEAEALTRIFPYLVRVVLPRGAIDLQRKLPISDTALIATTNVLMVRKEVYRQLSISWRKQCRRHMARRIFFKRPVNFLLRPIRNIPCPKALAISTKMVPHS